MAHWFHRNPLKATAKASFDLGRVVNVGETSKICSDIRLLRAKLLGQLRDANNDLEMVETDFKSYLQLMSGFVFEIDSEDQDLSSAKDSKLRILQQYKWCQSLLGNVPIEVSDSWFEVLSMATNMALWYSKHAAKVAGKDEIREDEAKGIHRCLRKAAGLFEWVAAERQKLDVESVSEGTDVDSRVLTAYIKQSTAEAQEVTVARAISLKHQASLVSALSYETATLFNKAHSSLKSLTKSCFDKWRAYLALKENFYLAFAYSYLGEKLLAEDKCGDAIRALRESQTCYDKALAECAVYRTAEGPGLTIKPEKHQFFQRLKPIVDRTLEKCERENGFIYHHKIPEELPLLEMKATYGLVEPELFSFPERHSLWTVSAYAAFDMSKAAMPDFSRARIGTKELPAVKEEPIYQSERGQSACGLM